MTRNLFVPSACDVPRKASLFKADWNVDAEGALAPRGAGSRPPSHAGEGQSASSVIASGPAKLAETPRHLSTPTKIEPAPFSR